MDRIIWVDICRECLEKLEGGPVTCMTMLSMSECYLCGFKGNCQDTPCNAELLERYKNSLIINT